MGLRYDPLVAPAIRALPPAVKRQVRAALDALGREGLAESRLDIRPLHLPAGNPTYYRVRVKDYRIVAAVRGSDLYIVRVFHRRDGYGWLERLG